MQSTTERVSDQKPVRRNTVLFELVGIGLPEWWGWSFYISQIKHRWIGLKNPSL
jgi:hypothetical protein